MSKFSAELYRHINAITKSNSNNTTLKVMNAFRVLKGYGTAPDISKAFGLLDEEVRRENIEAIYFLGNLKWQKEKLPDLEQSIVSEIFKRRDILSILRTKASDGNPLASFIYGMRYFKGDGVDNEQKLASKMFLEAHEKGLPEAISIAGYILASENTPETDKEAFKLLSSASETMNPSAMFNLGIMYEYNRGVDQNDVEDLKWYRAAALRGITMAIYRVGLFNYQGRGGIEKNLEEVIKWFEKAADRGNATARSILGSELMKSSNKDYVRVFKCCS